MKDDDSSTHDRLIAMWGIQDALLQSYRNIFITSQSIIFAIAAFIASGDEPFLSLIMFPFGIYLLLKWSEICEARGLDVSYIHWQLLKLENGETVDQKIFTKFKEWQKNENGRELLENDEKYGAELLESETRITMEKKIPQLFWILWSVLFLFIIWPSFLKML